MLRRKLGWLLMRVGAKLAFVNDMDSQLFKGAINVNTWVGAQSESGGHLLGSIQPMCDYDTQSVINVLKLPKSNEAQPAASEKDTYYSESWHP